MIAGTKYRGQFEERLKKAVEEISKDDKIVLFIDEIHTLVGAGSAEGTMDAANILKPLLARGEIMCIGATTRGEYKKTILKHTKTILNRTKTLRIYQITYENVSK